MNFKNLTWKGSRERPLIMDVSWHETAQKMPVVIFAHGYKGFKDWGAWGLMGNQIVKSGCLFLKFNFSFNGGTLEQPEDFPDLEAFGQNNYTTEVGDISRAVDFVNNSNILPKERLDLENIVLIGHSRGGGMAILTSGKDHRIKKLITLASISDLTKRQPSGEALEKYREKGVFYVKNNRTRQLMPHYYQMYEDYHAHISELSIQDSASRISKPWLIVHGNKDLTVDVAEAYELKELNPNAELVEMESANHVFGAKHPWESDDLPEDLKKVTDLIVNFIQH